VADCHDRGALTEQLVERGHVARVLRPPPVEKRRMVLDTASIRHRVVT
jgi:hypothetical protein